MMISKLKLFKILNNEYQKNKIIHDKLTTREIEIIELLVNGNNSDAISNQLNIAKNTVATHRKNIKKKTKFSTSKDFVLFALTFDMIK